MEVRETRQVGMLFSSLHDVLQWKTRIAVGRMAFDAGFYSQAVRHFRTALSLIKEANLSSDLLSVNLVNLAKALACLGEYDEAEKLVQEALQIDTASENNLLLLACDYLELASISWKQHRAEQCEVYARKVIDLLNTLDKKERAQHAESIARAYKLLAIIKDEGGSFDQALKLIDQALVVLESMPQGIKSQAYGEALMVKVMVLIDKGEMEQVDAILEDAVQLIELHKGQFHPQLSRMMHILVQHLQKNGRPDFNKTMLEQFNQRKIQL